MIELWIPATIAAAFFQNLRSALQKHLTGRLSTSGAAYARFVYALPFALIYLLGLNYWGGFEYPEPNPRFYFFCVLGGLSQIMFTVFLLWMFSFRSFAVGTTFSKLEVLAVGVLGMLILGDALSPIAVLAVALGAAGVVLLSAAQSDLSLGSVVSGIMQKPTMIGLASAVWLGASVVFFRGAALSLGHDQLIMAAAYTLLVGLVVQTFAMGIYLLLIEPGELQRVFRNWRWAGAVGIAGAVASIFWYTAFTHQNAGYVRALGQIELVFTFIATTLIFGEKVNRLEVVGILLVGAGVVLITLAG